MNNLVFVTIVSVILFLSGCGDINNGSSISDYKSNSEDQTIVSFWDFSAHMLGMKPAVIFAAWSDGSVVFRVDKNGVMKINFQTPMEIPHCKLMIGSVEPSAINSLIETAKQAGALNPPIKDGILLVDGPMQTISIKYKDQQQLLHYHGREDIFQEDLKRIGTNSVPSRQDIEKYVKIWKTITNAIVSIEPKRMAEFSGKRELIYPKAWWMIEEENQLKLE